MNKEAIRKYSMPLTMVVFSALIYLVGLFLVPSKLAWGLGIIFGLIMSLLKLWLMETTFTKAMGMTEARAKAYTQRHYMLRYLLTGIVLFIAAIEPSISLFGVFFGLWSMKAGAYMELAFIRK